jgi:hypothetical protein
VTAPRELIAKSAPRGSGGHPFALPQMIAIGIPKPPSGWRRRGWHLGHYSDIEKLRHIRRQVEEP